jgi:hypothetical protein
VGIAEILYEHGAKLDAKTSDDLTVCLCPGIVLLVTNSEVADDNIMTSKHYLLDGRFHIVSLSSFKGDGRRVA